MPENFTMILARELQVDPANVSRAVNLEKTNSKRYWPAIERLAIQSDSKAYRERIKFLEKQRQPRSKAAQV